MIIIHVSTPDITQYCPIVLKESDIVRAITYKLHTMVNAFCVCTLHGVTYHVPGVVITSRGAYSCKAAPDLGELSP